MALSSTKNIAQIQAEAGEEGAHTLKRTLSATNLVMLGIGAIIGAGIFVLTGTAAANNAGPAVVISFVIAGLACLFAGLCYAEFASMIPVAGSAYTYAYATLGELVAWIIGWDLILEYLFGAASVMMGSMLAGTEESPGESLLLEGRRFKMIRGMGSLSAMQDGSADRYFQEGEMSPRKLVPEGIEGRVPYKGPVSDVLFQMVGGLRSGMGYVGCATVDELRTESEFVRITAAGLRESHPHDVTITREAPNYHG